MIDILKKKFRRKTYLKNCMFICIIFYLCYREEAKKSKESAWKFLTRKRKPLHSMKENQLLLEDTEKM